VETSITKGKDIIYGVIITIVLFQILTDITNDTPLLVSLIRFSLLFILLVLLQISW